MTRDTPQFDAGLGAFLCRNLKAIGRGFVAMAELFELGRLYHAIQALKDL
jgi:hypothetical protein